MEKIFCEKCSSKHVTLGICLELVSGKLTPAIAGICSECDTRVTMPEYSLEEFILEDLADHTHLNPHDYQIARAYPIELLLDLDSRNKGESLCCGTAKGFSVLSKQNAIKCHDCGSFYNPIHITQQQFGYEREEAVAYLVDLQYSRLNS